MLEDNNNNAKTVSINDIPEIRLLSGQDKAVLAMLDEGMDLSFGVIDPDLRYVYISQYSYELLSLDKDDVKVGDHVTDLHAVMLKKGLFTPEMMQKNKLSVEEDTNQLQNRESTSRQQTLGNGQTVAFQRIKLDNGYTISIAQDVSKLAEKDQLLTQALVLGNAGYWTYCIEDKIYKLNSTLAAILSDEQKASIDKNGILSIFHPEDCHLFTQAIKNISTNGDKFEYTARVAGKHKDYTWGRTVGQLIRDKNGQPKELRAFVTDVTKEIEQAEELMKTKDAAIAASQAKSEFLANMSHEIRTPMNGILGMAELLSHTKVDDRQKQFLNVINNSASSLLTIINDILDFSKIEAGALELDLMPFDLKSSINDVTSLLITNAQAKGLELIINYPVEMPTAFVGDAGRLRQVITNLISNAIKFTETGHITIDVNINLKDALGFVNVSVRDTGIGIAPDKLSVIFEKFTQADGSTTRVYGGTGLGLTISKRIVELMNGTIKASSTLGQGANFEFQIPLQRDLNAKPDQLDLTDIAGKAALIIDDIHTNRHILFEQLKHWNVDALTVEDGPEALSLIRSHQAAGVPFDFILLDYLMPGLNGHELARIMHSSADIKPVPIIMLSSCDQSISTQELNDIGIQSYLLKPVREKRLFETITEVLSQAENQIAKERVHEKDLTNTAAALNSDSDTPPLLAGDKSNASEHLSNQFSDVGMNMVDLDLDFDFDLDLGFDQDFDEGFVHGLTSPEDSHQLHNPAACETPPVSNSKEFQVLVAEDYALNRDVVRLMLADTDFTPVFVVDGQKALEAYTLDPSRFSAILMDVSMPVMDGYEAARKIREFEAHNEMAAKPIIALTGHALIGDRDLCLEAGMNDYLSKPVKQTELIEVLSRYTETNPVIKTA